MWTPTTLAAALAAPLLVMFAAALLALPRRLREHRAECTRHQIALTDALDEACGPVVAPVVTRALSGAWRIEMAMPPLRPSVIGRIIALVNRTLLAQGINPRDARIVLISRRAAGDQAPAMTLGQAGGHWLDAPVAP